MKPMDHLIGMELHTVDKESEFFIIFNVYLPCTQILSSLQISSVHFNVKSNNRQTSIFVCGHEFGSIFD